MRQNTDRLKKYKPTHQQFTYESFPFYWIARASSLYSQRMEKVLKKSGITITGWRIGIVLREHESLNISELSKHCSFNPSTVTKTVYLMQKKGWLAVTQGKADGRVSKVNITPKGCDCINQLIADTSKIIDMALAPLSEKELLQINVLLRKTTDHLADY